MTPSAPDAAATRAPGNAPAPNAEGSRVALQHRVFHLFPGHFKLAEPDERPVYAINLGDQVALLPMSALRREFGIDSDHPDNALLQRIDSAVEYVDKLEPGDPLPSEVVDGSPSWAADQRYRREAMDGLQIRLALWLAEQRAEGQPRDPNAAATMRRQLGTALVQKMVIESYEKIAPKVGLPEGDRHGVVERVEALGDSLAHVEALRDAFDKAFGILSSRIEGASMSRTLGNDSAAREAAFGLVRLQSHATQSVRDMFAAIDSRVDDIVALVRDVEPQRHWIAGKRNELYRISRRIIPIARRWDAIIPGNDHATRDLLLDTYRTLARRFLPQQEWARVTENMRKKLGAGPARQDTSREWSGAGGL